MDILREETLDVVDSIRSIDLTISECSLNVYDALLREYDKMMYIMEYSDEASIFQEESILDKATGKNTGDSTIKKIVLFLPRLLMAIVQAIGSIFTKDYKKETNGTIQQVDQYIAGASNEQLVAVSNELSKETKGNIKFDPEKKRFSLFGKFRHIKNYIMISIGFSSVLKKFKYPSDKKNIPYRQLADDLMAVLKKEKEMDAETVTYTLQSLKDLMGDTWKASIGLKGICNELIPFLDERIKKDFSDGKNTEKLEDAKRLAECLKKGAGIAATLSAFGSIPNTLRRLFGRKKLHEAKYRDEYGEIEDLKRENRSLSGVNQELKKERKKEEKLHEKKMGLFRKNDKLKSKVDKNQAKLDTQRDEQNDELLKYELGQEDESDDT